jgi:hypothetical protein
VPGHWRWGGAADRGLGAPAARLEDETAEAAFPGVNGKIVFESNRTTSANPTGEVPTSAVTCRVPSLAR